MGDNVHKKRGARVRYVTPTKLKQINPENIKVYEQYTRSKTSRNKDVAKTTYKTYSSYFNIFLCFILEHYDNRYILEEDLVEEDMIDIMEHFIMFLQEELNNNKKTINTKLSAVSSFYHWAVKRRKIKGHPFDGRLERMQGANDEKIIAEHFLSMDEVDEIVDVLREAENTLSKYDKIDQLIWHIAYDSACRIGALEKLTVSSLDFDRNCFVNIREKRGKIVNIPFSPQTAKLIREFLDQREILGIDCDALFYRSKAGEWGGMSPQAIHNRIKRIGLILGVDDFRPHSIRKTRINHVYKKDVNLAQQLANHDDMSTTQKFYTEKEDQSDVFSRILELDL